MANSHGAVTQSTGKLVGRFDRMFKGLAPGTFGASEAEVASNMRILGAAMGAGLDAPKDGLDNEESGIPALYTYFGQFVDHDLTLGLEGQFSVSIAALDKGLMPDQRTPSFDLDNVYGHGPGDQPYMYDQLHARMMLRGTTLYNGTGDDARDLPRNTQGRALIGDKRDDENTIVSQLQGLFLQFHNRYAALHPTRDFNTVRQEVTWHYQWIVLNDFLAAIVENDVLATLKDATGSWDRTKLVLWPQTAVTMPMALDNEPYMPIEYSVAAYRLGHSMIRPGYRLNDKVLVPIFPDPADPKEGLTGFQAVDPERGIDWGRFIDVDTRDYGTDPEDPAITPAMKAVNAKRLQFAYKIDTSLVEPLSNLPVVVAGNTPFSLAERNLKRGVEFKLPSGQDVVAAINAQQPAGATPIPVINAADIIIGKATGDPADVGTMAVALQAAGASLNLPQPQIDAAVAVFNEATPLWTYILAEAGQKPTLFEMPINVTPAGTTVATPQLGPVGGRIVAETFLALMFGDSASYLNSATAFAPMQVGSATSFGLREFVMFATAP